MKYKFLVTGDIHFGYYPPELLYKEFQLILDTIDKYEPDCVVIAGDYYDTKLSMASAHSVYSVKAFSDLIKVCEDKNIKVRQIKGTNSHDPENQLKNLAQIANSSRCDYKLILTVDEEEIFPGMNVLYIPEEYMEDSKEYYKEYFSKSHIQLGYWISAGVLMFLLVFANVSFFSKTEYICLVFLIILIK